MQNKIYDHALVMESSEENEFTPAEINQMVEVLSIVLIGILLSSVIFIMEVICKSVLGK